MPCHHQVGFLLLIFGDCVYYLGIMDGHLHTSHPLTLTVKLDLGNPTELSQNGCQVVFQVDYMTNAVSRAYQ